MEHIRLTSDEINEDINRLVNIALVVEGLLDQTKREEQQIKQKLEVLKQKGFIEDSEMFICCGDELRSFLEKISNAKKMLETISIELEKCAYRM